MGGGRWNGADLAPPKGALIIVTGDVRRDFCTALSLLGNDVGVELVGVCSGSDLRFPFFARTAGCFDVYVVKHVIPYLCWRSARCIIRDVFRCVTASKVWGCCRERANEGGSVLISYIALVMDEGGGRRLTAPYCMLGVVAQR